MRGNAIRCQLVILLLHLARVFEEYVSLIAQGLQSLASRTQYLLDFLGYNTDKVGLFLEELSGLVRDLNRIS